MPREVFSELLESVLRAGAIKRGELAPGRVIDFPATSVGPDVPRTGERPAR